MKLSKCKNGHFYDMQKYTECPHCVNLKQQKYRIKFFDDVLKLSRKIGYTDARIYYENFICQSRQNRIMSDEAIVKVEDSNTLKSAYNHGVSAKKKTAVLNFANPVNPGGGVTMGAVAQEEFLCRRSNLYLSLLSPYVRIEYYQYNKELNNYYFSDRIVYSRDITVFNIDDNLSLNKKRNWFNVDVITCAAPYLNEGKYKNITELKNVFKSRIKNIFESAIDNGIEVIILGAFGCGAFNNPPELVVDAFKEVIEENAYLSFFDKIVFAIKASEGARLKYDRNLAVFKRWFYGISEEMNKLRYDPHTVNDTIISLDGTDYRLLEKLDRRGFSPVYACENVITNRKYAIEIISHSQYDDDVFESNKLFENIIYENICRIISMHKKDDDKYVVMEYEDGMTLEELLGLYGLCGDEFAKEIMFKMAELLAFLHSKQPPIIHRDIKPHNIILTDNLDGDSAKLKLINFDIAIPFYPGVRNKNKFGSVGYAPDEQYDGYAVPASDIYALGKTMVYLLTGKKPEVRSEYDIRVLKLNISVGLYKIIEKCIKEDPNERFRDGVELLNTLKKFEDENEFITYVESVNIESAIKQYKLNQSDDLALYMVLSSIMTKSVYLPHSASGTLLGLDVGNKEIIPIFTSLDYAHGDNVILRKCYLKDYIHEIRMTKKYLVVNPFDEDVKFVIPWEAVDQMLIPAFDYEMNRLIDF